MDELKGTADEAARKALCRKAQKIIAEDAVNRFLFAASGVKDGNL